MLQPLAVTIVSGLSFSTLVSLVLVPLVYRFLGAPTRAETSTVSSSTGVAGLDAASGVVP
jgi:Cu/Ag efflux pump CusA